MTVHHCGGSQGSRGLKQLTTHLTSTIRKKTNAPCCSAPLLCFYSPGCYPGNGVTHSREVLPPQLTQSRQSLRVCSEAQGLGDPEAAEFTVNNNHRWCPEEITLKIDLWSLHLCMCMCAHVHTYPNECRADPTLRN